MTANSGGERCQNEEKCLLSHITFSVYIKPAGALTIAQGGLAQ